MIGYLYETTPKIRCFDCWKKNSRPYCSICTTIKCLKCEPNYYLDQVNDICLKVTTIS